MKTTKAQSATFGRGSGQSMHVRLRLALVVALGAARGRYVEVLPDDSFIVSYPRSGNTWTRFLIGNLITDKEVEFSNIEAVIPDIYANREWTLRRCGRPRLLKSHEAFDARYARTLYIVRDPRDVVISYYYFQLKMRTIPGDTTLDDYVSEFIKHGFCEYGTWGENVGSWLGARQGGACVHVIRYEDLLRDTAGQLREAAEFLGTGANEERIQSAIVRSSPEAMRNSEMKDFGQWRPTRGSRDDIPFVRSATSGGWRESLSPCSAKSIEHAWPTLMHELGYTDMSAAVGRLPE